MKYQNDIESSSLFKPIFWIDTQKIVAFVLSRKPLLRYYQTSVKPLITKNKSLTNNKLRQHCFFLLSKYLRKNGIILANLSYNF